MKVMILGARGMLGTDLLPILAPRHDLSCMDVQEFDITDRKAVADAVSECGPRAVINLAAYTDVDKCESERERAFAVNAEGALNVALACREAGCRLIHLSTDYVFDGNAKKPYAPEAEVGPVSVYGASKLEGERHIRKNLADHLIIRTAWMFGRHGKNFVDTILRLAAQQCELRVVDDQKGSPTYTRHMGLAIEKILETDIRGILHVTNSGTCTWFGFARKILEMKPPARPVRVIPISSAELARPAKRPAYSVMDGSRFEEVTRWRMPSWEEGLREYLGSAGE
ncbi:MAG TPA: dTDP-4-dehydrorhamnose reductase [Thermodesulfobacteriota bacterium]|nr:dTDP-4-dehydrorhamnose reductase [Thermodesulfobacteriota bacterium]